MLLLALLSATTMAAPLLVFVMDVAEPGLRAWWRDGDLIVGPPTQDERPGMRPLVGQTPVPIPGDLSDWTALGETCQTPPATSFDVDGHAALATTDGSWTHPMIVVAVDGRMVASAQLGRPARICQITVGQADLLPGPEVLVSWRLGAGDDEVRGLTVFRLPATAR